MIEIKHKEPKGITLDSIQFGTYCEVLEDDGPFLRGEIVVPQEDHITVFRDRVRILAWGDLGTIRVRPLVNGDTFTLTLE